MTGLLIRLAFLLFPLALIFIGHRMYRSRVRNGEEVEGRASSDAQNWDSTRGEKPKRPTQKLRRRG